MNPHNVKFGFPGYKDCSVESNYLEIDLNNDYLITALKVSGIDDTQDPAMMIKFEFEYSLDNITWQFVKDPLSAKYVSLKNIIEFTKNIIIV